MELKPSKGLKVKVNARREAVFGDEAVAVQSVVFPEGRGRLGVLTGTVLVGFCEVDMPDLDGRRHWYPVSDLTGENGEQIVEEPIEVEVPEDEDDTEE